METIWNLGENLFLCFCGLLGYSLVAIRNHIGNFRWSIFWGHNKNFFVYAILCQLLYAIVMVLYPVLEETLTIRILAALDALSGQDLNIPEDLGTVVVYLTLTWQLSRWVNNSVSSDNKIGEKKKENSETKKETK